jgi:acyl carrier protein
MQERIERVFREVFDNDSLEVSSELSQETYPDWDSFSQVKLIIGLEEEFGVKFTTAEVLEASSVAKIGQLLESKL